MSGHLRLLLPGNRCCCSQLAGFRQQHAAPVSLARTQVRGKKKSATPTSIAVRLRKDIPAYGHKGSVIPIPLGMMRNVYYPQQLADYIAAGELKRMKREGISIERDFAFGKDPSAIREEVGSTEAGAAPAIDLKTLSPSDAFDLLEQTLPPTLEFRRVPIGPADSRNPPERSSSAPDEVVQSAPPPEVSPRQTPSNIYGSVSSEDVSTAIKALLHNRGLVGLVTLPEEDIKFVNIAGTDVEARRIKKLGEFEYEVRIRGHEGVIRRGIRVLPENEQASGQDIPAHSPAIAVGQSDSVHRAQHMSN